MIIPNEIVDTMLQSLAALPAIVGSEAAPAAPAAKAGGEKSEGGGALGKAIGIGFLILILAKGTMPAETQFALIGGVIAYFVFSKPSK